MRVLRALTKIAINRFGYDVRRVASSANIHSAGPGADPVTFEYQPNRRGYVLFDVALLDARAFGALALPLRPDRHPLVRAMALALAETDEMAARAAIEDIMRGYYEAVRPASAFDVIGIDPDAAPGLRDAVPGSDDHPIDASVLPWNGRAPAEIREVRRRTATFEGLQHGVRSRLEDGVTAFGPVTQTKLTLEVDRLLKLLKSVRSRGFIRHDPRTPLQVAGLRRGEEYRWLIHSGQHRFAAAAAFGVDTLPAMVTQVIRGDDARYWPQVVSGIFTEAGATAIFDRIFDGSPAPVCEPWITKLAGARSHVGD